MKIVTITCPIGPFSGERERTHDYESLAGTTVGRMERHVCHITHVDPNRWQDPARTHSSSESLVEYYPVCNASWTHDNSHALQWSTAPNRLRFH